MTPPSLFPSDLPSTQSPPFRFLYQRQPPSPDVPCKNLKQHQETIKLKYPNFLRYSFTFFRYLTGITLQMKKLHLAYLLPLLLSLAPSAHSQSSPDSSVMQALKSSLKIPSAMNWSHTNPCQWGGVSCDSSNRVTRIQIPGRNLGGTLPPDLKNLTQLEVLEVMNNQLDGAVPSLSGLNSLQEANFHNNNFSSFPSDFFYGLSSLQSVTIDYNPFASWEIPSSLQDASSLQSFSANGANITGTIPGFLGGAKFPQLTDLHLAMNNLVGALPDSFASSSIRSLWLNGQKLNATIDVVLNMTFLSEVWLHGNQFSGPLPDFSQLTQMRNLSLRDNQFTGVVPASLINLPSLFIVNLTNNMLQGPTPKFKDGVIVDMNNGSNSFCLDDSGVPCDDRVNILLSIVAAMNYPTVFAQRWKGNDPCSNQWLGITCDKGNITRVNFRNLGLSGTISSNFSMLPSLTYIDLSNNNLTGTIPAELTKLTALTHLDVSNNRLYGKLPSFSQNIDLNTAGNPDIGKDSPSPSGSPGTNTGKTGVDNGGTGGKSRTGIVVGVVVGAVCILGLVGLGVCLFLMKLKRSGRVQSPDTMLIRSQHSDNCDGVKITVTSRTGGGSDAHSQHSSSVPSEIHVVEAGNMVISVEVLRDVTNNFSDENILGRGGFGTVYKGELHDGTKIAVKRMESSMVGDKGLVEFKSEIAVLTKVRHRNLVALLGYCLDGNERLLVFEYMPQGTLSRHLFNWKEEGLKPLEWTRRLTIALDVARGVEYLHNLAHKSFIHRDLKPSNILLGDDLRAKVSDFGLVRLAPEGDRQSIQTRIAGTFGYLAPEYAATGRVTTKVDVFSFGVILMELITGRKALDETQPEESVHLVTWFRRVHVNKDTFEKAIDPMIDLNEETLGSINTVAELGWHCCAREPYQRPEMGHCVNVLSSLAELWKPAEKDPDDVYGIDLDMTLPQALKKWQAFEGSSYIGDSSPSSYLDSTDNTQTSIPTRPAGFAESFASADGR